MPHPIFDVSPFAIARPEANALSKALLTAVSNAAAINLLYRKVSIDLEPLNQLLGPKLVWVEALDNLAAASLLEPFCVLLQTELKTDKAVQKAVTDVINAPSDVARSVLGGGVFVVDRVPLRGFLGMLMARGSPVGVLLVRGARKTGKSHGHYLFDAAAREVGAQPVYIGTGMAATVDDLFTQLFGVLGAIDQIPPKKTTTDAWYGVVCGQLLALAMARKMRLWIAVDDLGFDDNGVTLLDEEIRNFCNKLALNMQAPQYQDWFRLMLIHYPDTIPTQWPDPIWKADELTPTDIDLQQVIDFLSGWSTERKKSIVASRITSLSTDLLANVNAAPAPGEVELPRLQRLYRALTALTQQLEQT